MAISTCGIGLLPTYEQIGIFSSILLTLCRILQGIAIGGEFTCSIVYIIEHGSKHNKGLYGSLTIVSAFIGIFLGSVVSFIINLIFTGSEYADIAWRIPFILGTFLVIVGLYFRKNMPETPEFKKKIHNATTIDNNIPRKLKTNIPRILHVAVISFVPVMSLNLIFIYLITYLEKYLFISPIHASLINFINILLVIIFIPLFGYISDFIERKILMVIGLIGFIILSYPLFLIISRGNLLSIMFAQGCFAILISLVFCSLPTLLFESFDSEIRCTAISFAYNIANSIVGGTAPLISTILIHHFGITAPSIYLVVLSLLSIPLIITHKS